MQLDPYQVRSDLRPAECYVVSKMEERGLRLSCRDPDVFAMLSAVLGDYSVEIYLELPKYEQEF